MTCPRLLSPRLLSSGLRMPGVETVMTADEQVIQGILQQIETAWNRYDSVSLAAVFAEDANFIRI